MPNLCVVPTTTSAPHFPGGSNNVNDNKSAATTIPILNFFSLEIKPLLSNTAPFLLGYCKIEPKKLSSISTSLIDEITSSIPNGSDLVSSNDIVCGKQSDETKNLLQFVFFFVCL